MDIPKSFHRYLHEKANREDIEYLTRLIRAKRNPRATSKNFLNDLGEPSGLLHQLEGWFYSLMDMFPDMDGDMFTAACYKLNGDSIEYSLAAHEFGVLIDDSGITKLEPPVYHDIIGAGHITKSNERFTQYSANFSEGSRLLIFTDGAIDTRVNDPENGTISLGYKNLIDYFKDTNISGKDALRRFYNDISSRRRNKTDDVLITVIDHV